MAGNGAGEAGTVTVAGSNKAGVVHVNNVATAAVDDQQSARQQVERQYSPVLDSALLLLAKSAGRSPP